MMINNRIFQQISHKLIRHYATKNKPVVIPDQSVLDDISENKYKPRNHRGVLKPRIVSLPDALVKAVQNVTQDEPVKAILEDTKPFLRHLKGKNLPIERIQLIQTTREIKDRVISRYANREFNSEAEENKQMHIIKDKINTILREKVYNWKPENYDQRLCLLYLFSRLAPEYAVLVKIFAEIVDRDPDFKPKSLFDFGSGVGSVTWAANNYWKKSLFEYFNVDSSVYMNDLAHILLQDGKTSKQMDLRGVYFRQFLPATNINYDIVISAYSFLELPSQQARLETVLNLWNKTQQYLVLVEQGNNTGFKIINELRDYILQISGDSAHVFSPCPHDNVCPRFVANDGTPCNFSIKYFTLPVGQISETKNELYSYVVIKKGERKDLQWPRVVRENLVRSKHSICRVCTKKGTLQEVIFTSKRHGKVVYHCARSTKWGDRLPISLEEPPPNEEEIRETEEEQ